MLKLITSILILTQSLLYAKEQNNKKKSLYEIGLASFVGNLPDYPASDQTKIKVLAVPTFQYRGKTLRNDNKGMRARFLKGDDWIIDLSFGGSLPADSDSNKARDGMSDLDLLLEVGPRFNQVLYEKDKYYISYTLPIRLVSSFSLDHIEEQGFRFNPEIYFSRTSTNNTHIHRVSLNFKLNYGTEKLNDYFYEVSQSDTRVDRARYNSQAGYIGRSATAWYAFKTPRYQTFFGLKLSDYTDSINRKSDLHRSNYNTSVFTAFNFYFYQSKKKAFN